MPYSDDLARAVMRNLQAQLRSNNHYDVTISVQNQNIPCHRLILCACSKYFRHLLQNHDSSEPIHLRNVKAETFKQVLECIYGAEDVIQEENASELWRAACRLEIDFLDEACEQFKLVRLSAKSCVEINNLAKDLGSHRVKKAASDELAREFRTVYARGDFVTLDFDDMLALVSREDLAVTCEDVVVMAVLKWLEHSPEVIDNESNDAGIWDMNNRKGFLLQLMSSCRLYLASGSCIHTLINTNWVIQKKKAYSLVHGALSYQLQPERRGLYCPPQAVHRSYSPHENCIVSLFRNSNGSQFLSCRDPEGTYYRLGGEFSASYIAAYGRDLYVVGSKTLQRGNALSVRKLNTMNGAWQDMPSLESTSALRGLICLDHYIYALDVANPGTLHRFDVLEGAAGEWEKVGRLDKGVRNVALALSESAIAILGNESGAQNVTIQIFDTLTMTCHLSPFKLDSNASSLVTFQTADHHHHTYALLSTGQVWKLDTRDRRPEYKGMLFEGEIPLLSAVTFKDELLLSLCEMNPSMTKQWNTHCVAGVSGVKIIERPGSCLLNAVIPVSLMVQED